MSHTLSARISVLPCPTRDSRWDKQVPVPATINLVCPTFRILQNTPHGVERSGIHHNSVIKDPQPQLSRTVLPPSFTIRNTKMRETAHFAYFAYFFSERSIEPARQRSFLLAENGSYSYKSGSEGHQRGDIWVFCGEIWVVDYGCEPKTEKVGLSARGNRWPGYPSSLVYPR
jgi:hypothetical protein